MRAVEFESGRMTLNRNRPLPRPTQGDVLVRVLCAGICETDLQLLKGYMGFSGVPGHEFVGIPEEGYLAGQRVVGEINCPCGNCELCRAGLGNHCPHRTVLGILNRDGAFADYVSLPETNLHPVPDSLLTDEAVFTEPLAAAFQIPVQVPLHKQQRVIVLGDGRLGYLCAQVIAEHGCRLLAVGKHPEKLALLQRRGIETALLADVSPDRSADLVVDCTGSPTGLPTALRLVKPRGTVILKTTVAGEFPMSLAPVVIDEVTVVGSRCGPFDKAIEALRTERIEVLPLITARYSLDDAAAAFERASSPGSLKILVDVWNES